MLDNQTYEFKEQNYNDPRFGNIDLLFNMNEPEKLLLSKTKQCLTIEEHNMACSRAAERLKLNNDFLLKMIDFNHEEAILCLQVLFEFREDNLRDRREALRSPAEQLRFLHDSLSALAHLETHRIVHGNVRPEYLHFDAEKSRYVLLDRLNDVLPPLRAQRNNIRFGSPLFLPGELFESLASGKQGIKHCPFRTDVFCLGMVFLAALLDDDEAIQSIYDVKQRRFDREKFVHVAAEINSYYFARSHSVELGQFIFSQLVPLDYRKVLTPCQALVALHGFIKRLVHEPLKVSIAFMPGSMCIMGDGNSKITQNLGSVDELVQVTEPFTEGRKTSDLEKYVGKFNVL